MAYEITIPRLGWSMEEGTFSGWLKQDGDTVRPGDPLFELEGEKAIQEVEAVDEGILRIPPTCPQPGSVVQVGTVVGYLVAAGESLPADPGSPADSSNAAAPRESSQEKTSRSDFSQTATEQALLPPAAGPAVRRMAREAGVPLEEVEGTGRGGRILAEDIERATSTPRKVSVASPRARRTASQLGMDWTRLTGTGSGGRIREQDVLAASHNRNSEVRQGTTEDEQRLPLSNRRRVIAERMVASRQQTVPVTLTTKAVATNLVKLRDEFKASSVSSLVPTYQDIIMKLVGNALRRHLPLAGRWHEEENVFILPAEYELHLRMAVDTDDGLLVPVLHNVTQMSLTELAVKSRQLIDQARKGKLTAAEMQGGVFTISNLGAFGIDAFTPIINLPESAILGLGAIRREPVVMEDGGIGARHHMTLSLTFDHRFIDGAPAARFLQDIADSIANPAAVLLS